MNMNTKNSLGDIISELRKKKNMTQKDLAEKINVTDKAVSKWERNISTPDANLLPKLANILGISVEELLNAKINKNNIKIKDIINTCLIGVSLALGICIMINIILDEINLIDSITMLALSITCISLYLLINLNK